MSGLGAVYLGENRCHFSVWAPNAQAVALHIVEPNERRVPMQPAQQGYFEATLDGIAPGTRYWYQLDDGPDLPDPASRFQPDDVHGPSAVVDATFAWSDNNWRNRPLADYIIYELHIGTFTPEGTFDAAIAELPYLRDLGITAIELLPVAQFPGERNWGYDGVFPFAVQHSYGGPPGLRRFVDACHSHGIAVILDVVYNHLGPEGNYFPPFGPYFTERYKTPWGAAINTDGPYSDEVRRFFMENALYWQREYHIDALRLDAIHEIVDQSVTHFLAELAFAMHRQGEELGRPFYTIAESDLNNPRLICPPEQGGVGLNAQWADDFHHALDPLLTGAPNYADDFGSIDQVVTAWQQAFVYTGQYAPSRKRRHGGDPKGMPAHQFIVFLQNHDQVGNRLFGARYTTMVEPPTLRLAAALVLLSPYVPLLWMGEEYGDPTPWMFFCSFSDQKLIAAVRAGRAKDFERFSGDAEQPDPQAEATFQESKLRLELREQGAHKELFQCYKTLIALRREQPALASLDNTRLEARAYNDQLLVVRRWAANNEVALVFNLRGTPVDTHIVLPEGQWHNIFGSTATTNQVVTSNGTTAVQLGGHAFVVLKRRL